MPGTEISFHLQYTPKIEMTAFMSISTLFLIIFTVMSITAATIYWLMHRRYQRLFNEKQHIESALTVTRARLDDATARLHEQKSDYNQSILQLEKTFKGLSADALKQNQKDFLTHATPALNHQLQPLQDALKRYETQLHTIEQKREHAYGEIGGLIESLQHGQLRLTQETSSLVAALKSPTMRGRWGEVTLRRVVELAGMSQHCDFDEQVDKRADDTIIRPDMVVHLPGNRDVIVDAKAPVHAYINATEATDDSVRQASLAAHAQTIRDHMRKLGQKAYWSQFAKAPDFVIMFLPGESFFSAALESDRNLIEDGMMNKVVLATPTTLIVLLRSIAMGWQQQQLTENSQRISDAGKDLFKRISDMASHLGKLGSSLETSTKVFNQTIGSWERRVMPGAKRLQELGATHSLDQEINELPSIESIPRSVDTRLGE